MRTWWIKVLYAKPSFRLVRTVPGSIIAGSAVSVRGCCIGGFGIRFSGSCLSRFGRFDNPFQGGNQLFDFRRENVRA